MIKYILKGGRVRSRTDGDMHHIPSWKLVDLYGLSGRNDWVMWSAGDTERYPDAIILGPRFDGCYRDTIKFLDHYPEPPQFNTVEEADAWLESRAWVEKSTRSAD